MLLVRDMSTHHACLLITSASSGVMLLQDNTSTARISQGHEGAAASGLWMTPVKGAGEIDGFGRQRYWAKLGVVLKGKAFMEEKPSLTWVKVNGNEVVVLKQGTMAYDLQSRIEQEGGTLIKSHT